MLIFGMKKAYLCLETHVLKKDECNVRPNLLHTGEKKRYCVGKKYHSVDKRSIQKLFGVRNAPRKNKKGHLFHESVVVKNRPLGGL